jgi:hypothetical protein
MGISRTAIDVAAATLATCLAAGHAAASSAPASVSCRGTLPDRAAVTGSGARGSSFNYGNARLRVHLGWRRGVLRAGSLPDGGSLADIAADGSITTKQGWWRGLAGRLVVTGRRLDGTAARLRAHVPAGYGSTGFVPVGLTFPTMGCWRVDGRLGTARLTYVVQVTRALR